MDEVLRRDCGRKRELNGWMVVNRRALAALVLAAASQAAQAQTKAEGKYASPAIARAMKAIQDAEPRAASDPWRPVFHYRPPAQFMNDPNGPIWLKGYYHLFHQQNPFGDRKGNSHWAHARSRDLVHWEYLPIALAPAGELGEVLCASGTTVIRKDAAPMILYSSGGSAPGKSLPERPDVWAAVAADEDLITWRRVVDNPILTAQIHGELPITRWRDPNHFVLDGRIYLVMSGLLTKPQGNRGVVTIYRAENSQLSQWTFLGILFEHPDDGITGFDCPELFKLGDRWVLVTLHGGINVDYFTGRFDASTFRFTAEHRDRIDVSPRGLSASASFWDGSGRRILWGWVRDPGWDPRDSRGWWGCMSVPRVLTMRGDGRLGYQPAPELRTLRGRHHHWADMQLDDAVQSLDGVSGDTLEIVAEFEPRDAKAYGLVVRRSADGRRGAVIRHDGKQLEATNVDPGGIFADLKGGVALPGHDYRVPLPLLAGEHTLRLHVFIDKSVMEIFINGRACFTRTIYPLADDLGIALFAEGGSTKVTSVDVWSMKSVW